MLNLPTELLRTFVKAVDTGSFTRAGEVVGRTQSAVSLQMRRLEEMAGSPLFARDTHRPRLTDAGMLLLGYARRMLALNDEAVGSLRRPAVAGSVCFGAPHEYGAALLPDILGKFAQRHPGVTLEVRCDLSKNLLASMEKEHFDLVIALHDEPDDPRGSKVHTEPLVWVTGAEHRTHQMRPLALIVAPPPCMYRTRLLQTLNQMEVPWRIAYVSSSYSGILAAVRAGLGVTLLAASTVPEGVRVLDEHDGFPALGHLDVRLHTTAAPISEAARYLADYVTRSLAGDGD